MLLGRLAVLREQYKPCSQKTVVVNFDMSEGLAQRLNSLLTPVGLEQLSGSGNIGQKHLKTYTICI